MTSAEMAANCEAAAARLADTGNPSDARDAAALRAAAVLHRAHTEKEERSAEAAAAANARHYWWQDRD